MPGHSARPAAIRTLRAALVMLALAAMPALASVPRSIEGTDLTGAIQGPVSLDLRDRDTPGTVVVFLSSRCPCSVGHEAKLTALAREFGPKGFRFVGVHSNADETPETARAHFHNSGLGFPVVSDPDQKLADALGALKTPHAFVIRGGRVAFQGGVDDSRVVEEATRNFLRDALQDLSEGKEPGTARARALGCLIRRK